MELNLNKKINRRRFLQASVASGLGLVSANSSAESVNSEAPEIGGQYSSPAPIPAKKGPRIVVVGGGWAGLTIAKHLKLANPNFDIVLLDKNNQFVSCPISNLWLADQVSLEFLTHSYVDAAHNHNYLFINATAIELDRDHRKLITTMGSIEYDYLVLAPGIDYDYSKIGIEDPEQEHHLRMHYPAGFNSASEIMAIKHKLHNFRGGTLALTIPSGNYRCMAAPYERSCMAAAILKKRRIKAKILVLDMNPGIRIKADGFKKAYEEFYSDSIQYEASTEINGVNVPSKEIETDFDSYAFDDAIIYPPIRASRLIEKLGLNDPQSPQKEGHIDPFKYHHVDDEHIFIIGDARSQPFSKSGNTATTEAKYVAEVISAHAKGKEIAWRSPQTMCFSGVKIDPLEAMSINAFYKYNHQEKSFAFDQVNMVENWDVSAGVQGLDWARGMYHDMFYK